MAMLASLKVAAGDQMNVTPPVALKVLLSPMQIVASGDMVTVGSGFTFTIA